MPKKVRRGKAFQQKRKRASQPAVAAAAEAAGTETTQKPAPVTPTAPSKTRTPAVKYPFVGAELRRIGIIAGAILIILIVLAFVL